MIMKDTKDYKGIREANDQIFADRRKAAAEHDRLKEINKDLLEACNIGLNMAETARELAIYDNHPASERAAQRAITRIKDILKKATKE